MNKNVFPLNLNDLKSFGLNPLHWLMSDVKQLDQNALVSLQHIDDPELQLICLAKNIKGLFEIQDLSFII